MNSLLLHHESPRCASSLFDISPRGIRQNRIFFFLLIWSQSRLCVWGKWIFPEVGNRASSWDLVPGIVPTATKTSVMTPPLPTQSRVSFSASAPQNSFHSCHHSMWSAPSFSPFRQEVSDSQRRQEEPELVSRGYVSDWAVQPVTLR